MKFKRKEKTCEKITEKNILEVGNKSELGISDEWLVKYGHHIKSCVFRGSYESEKSES